MVTPNTTSNITVRQGQDGIAEIRLKGYIDAYSYNQIEEVFNQIINKGIYKLIVDLSEVNYLSSVGAGLLINVFSRTQENRGNLVVLKPSPPVKEVLDLLGLSNLFTVTNDHARALGVFN